jgi:hypothetical protein
MSINGGINFQNDGAMDVIVADPDANSPTINGFRVNHSGAVFVETTATPGVNDPRRMGFAFTQTGKLYVTKGAVQATSSVQRGVAISINGAVHVTTAAPSQQFTQGGWTTSVAGVLYVNEL